MRPFPAGAERVKLISMHSVEVRVLGPLEVVASDGSALSPSPKQRRLLAALAIMPGRPQSLDTLTQAVWGASPPPSARKLLQVYVSQLRKLPAGDSWIATGRPGYMLAPESASVDATTFESLLAEGREALQDQNAALADSLLTRALALWRGYAYADVLYDDFARAEAERLEELRLVAIEERAEAQLRLGRPAELLAELRSLASQHPLRERLQALTMLALYRCGRQSEALEVYAAVRKRMQQELGLQPRAELRELQRQILKQDELLDVSGSPTPALGCLPDPPTALIGRRRELEDLHALVFRDDVRLLTLAGAGGSGKTRLALQLARELEHNFANGAAFIELAPLRDPRFVIPTIARAVGLESIADPSLETLAAAIRPLEMLLVLDNAEHLSEAAHVYADLAARTPRVTFVITSRSVLHVSGEHVYPVLPLAEEDAVELFCVRARALDPSFKLTEEVQADVRETCRRIDFLPLAVELAAGRIRTLTPRALRKRLTRRLTVLTGGPRDLPARQQTLRATLDWSVNLLEADERRALAWLSIFAGGCTAEAAEAVCRADLEILSTLVDHNLVRRVGTAQAPRFLLLETIREYTAERLQESGERGSAARAHADWCLDLAEAAEPHLTGPDQTRWFTILEAERDNLRQALLFLTATGDEETQLRLTIALSRYWYVRGHLGRARRWLDQALAGRSNQMDDLTRRGSTAAAAVSLLQGDYVAATRFAESALNIARRLGKTLYVANGLSNLGAIVLAAGDYDRAARLLEDAVELAREVGDARIAALAINNLGDLALTGGDYERAEPLFEESLELLRMRGDAANVARALFNLGAVALQCGRLGDAAARLRESVQLANEAGDVEDLAWCLEGVAALAVASRQPEQAALLLGASGSLLDEIGATFKPFERQLHASTESATRSLLGTPLFVETMRAGLAMELPGVLERARCVLESNGVAGTSPGSSPARSVTSSLR